MAATSAQQPAQRTAQPEPALRADAQRNRDRILVAAAEAFATSGADTPVEEIASAAGVAVGTLYRRFPDRQALIRGVALMNFAKTVAEVQLAAEEETTGWDALVRIFGDVAVAFVFLARQIMAPHIESAPLASQRILALVLDALRATPAEPLPGRPLTPADLGLD